VSHPGQHSGPDEVITPDLQDAVTIAVLARELEMAGGTA